MARWRRNPNPNNGRRRKPLMRRDLKHRLARAELLAPEILGSVGRQRTTGARYAPTSHCASSSGSVSDYWGSTLRLL